MLRRHGRVLLCCGFVTALMGVASETARADWVPWYTGYSPVYSTGYYTTGYRAPLFWGAGYSPVVTTAYYNGSFYGGGYVYPTGCSSCGSCNSCGCSNGCSTCGYSSCGSCGTCSSCGSCASGNCGSCNNCGAGYSPQNSNDSLQPKPASEPLPEPKQLPYDQFTPGSNPSPNMPNRTIPSGNNPVRNDAIPQNAPNTAPVPGRTNDVLPETNTTPNRTFEEPNNQFLRPSENRTPAPIEPARPMNDDIPEVLPFGTGTSLEPQPLEIESDLTARLEVKRHRVGLATETQPVAMSRVPMTPRFAGEPIGDAIARR